LTSQRFADIVIDSYEYAAKYIQIKTKSPEVSIDALHPTLGSVRVEIEAEGLYLLR